MADTHRPVDALEFSMVVDILIVLASLVGLWLGAIWLVEAACKIAKRVGIPELVVGLTIVALGTSAPEFAVTITAALRGHADLSVSNIVGSNIFNLGFVLGGVALVRSIAVTRKLVYRDGAILIGAALLILFFMRDLSLGRWEGATLMLLLVGYVALLFRSGEQLEEPTAGEMRWYDPLRLIAGLGLVLASGHFLVDSACHLAAAAGMSEWAIGVTIVAAGTSAPEMATALVAVLRGRFGILAGSLIGSDLFNLLGVLGLAAFLRPMSIDPAGFGSLAMLLGLVILVVVMMRTGWRVSRAEGAALVLLNLIRWISDFS